MFFLQLCLFIHFYYKTRKSRLDGIVKNRFTKFAIFIDHVWIKIRFQGRSQEAQRGQMSGGVMPHNEIFRGKEIPPKISGGVGRGKDPLHTQTILVLHLIFYSFSTTNNAKHNPYQRQNSKLLINHAFIQFIYIERRNLFYLPPPHSMTNYFLKKGGGAYFYRG